MAKILSLWIIFLFFEKSPHSPIRIFYYLNNSWILLVNNICTKKGQIEKGVDFKSLLRTVSGLFHKISTEAVEKPTDKFLSPHPINNKLDTMRIDLDAPIISVN